MSIKIILADDHQIIRDGLKNLIEKEYDMEVVAETNNGRTTIKLTRELKPDMVIIDIGMPDLNGVDATKQIVAGNPNIKVIALSMYSDKRFVGGMLNAGARGYLLKDCAFEELATAIRTVFKGHVYLSPAIVGIVVDDYVRNKKEHEQSPLSNREREIVQLITEGKTTKEIASKLFISIKTVETHRQHIMEKLNCHSIAELTKFAIREGLTSLDK